MMDICIECGGEYGMHNDWCGHLHRNRSITTATDGTAYVLVNSTGGFDKFPSIDPEPKNKQPFYRGLRKYHRK